VRFIRLFWLALLLLATSAAAQPTSYTAPEEFMDLFFDFTGSNEPDYPAGQPTLGQMLTQSVVARESGAPGPLVLVVGSKIYVYDSANGARLSEEQFRADRASGFFEMTAISHIGPALAYLAQIKANGDARWRERLVSLRMHTAEVRALNQRAAGNWLDLLNEPAWSTHKTQIRAMLRITTKSDFVFTRPRPQADIGWIEIPQRSNLLPHRGVLYFGPKARKEATGGKNHVTQV
jgi:hypothetical protein